MAFATTPDVQLRMGRDLTTAEEARVDVLLEQATGLIADACGKTTDWADDLDPVPTSLKVTVVEMVVRVMFNPTGARSQSEQLGAYQHTESYPDTMVAGGLMLTAAEELRCRRAVFGTLSGSSRLESVIDELADIAGVTDLEVDASA